MMRALKDRNLTTKDGEGTTKRTVTAASSSRLWLGLRDPRIVRVSRAGGGKDRHSKVCTVKGLRDRRVRLSVQTAIQLYDLQDKLGVSQPSKVVDWLLSAAQHEIDKLPPLQVPPNFPSLSGSVVQDVGLDLYKGQDGDEGCNRLDETNHGENNYGNANMGGYLSQFLLCPPGTLGHQSLMLQPCVNYPLINSAFHGVDASSNGEFLKASDYFSKPQQQ